MPTQKVGPLSPWNRRKNLSVDAHQEVITSVNQVRSFVGEDFEIRNGPHGRSVKAIPQRFAKLIEVQVSTNKITPESGGSITLAKGWFAGRMQIETGKAFDPSIDYDDDDYFDDFATKDDCYLFARVDSGVIITDGDVIVGRYLRDSLDNEDPSDMPSLPVIEVIASASAGGIFPVLLSYPTGSDGANSPPAQATLTYTVSDLEGNVLESNVSVWFARQYGHVVPAQHGYAFYNSDGTLMISECDEVIDVFSCPTS